SAATRLKGLGTGENLRGTTEDREPLASHIKYGIKLDLSSCLKMGCWDSNAMCYCCMTDPSKGCAITQFGCETFCPPISP
ncbi:hypothetical protein ACJRO7_030871, partial [Eucalyptus globulus]